MPVLSSFKNFYKNLPGKRTNTDIPVAHPRHATFFTRNYLFFMECVGGFVTLAETAIRGGVVTPLRYLWAQEFVEQNVVMPTSGLILIITVILAFAGMKCQCQPGFPFITHPHQVRLSINSVLMYGFCYAAELIASGLDRKSVFASIARLGKMSSLCLLVISLACLLYF